MKRSKKEEAVVEEAVVEEVKSPAEDGLYYYKTKDGKGWLGRFSSPITENVDNYEPISKAAWDAHIEEMKKAEEDARKAAEEAYNSDEAANARKIAELKAKLTATDYQAIKFAEGAMTAEEFEPIKAQRQEWRDEINSLEAK